MWVLGTQHARARHHRHRHRGGRRAGARRGAPTASATGEMSLPALLVILMLGVEVFRPLRELRILLHQGMLGLSAAAGHLRAARREAAWSATAPQPARPSRLAPTVAFEGVTFAYPGARRRRARRALSFRCGAGERVGIVGPSGAGKSTIARLLLRFYDPQSGRVLVGGRDLRELTPRPVAEPIARGQPGHLPLPRHRRGQPPDGQARRDRRPSWRRRPARPTRTSSSRAAAGLRDVVGERGVRLSGGQRQRIAIARALLRDAPILVLDEALSSVDAESEAMIQAALDRLMRGRTTLVFAHRLSSVIGADRILVLDEGRVAEQRPPRRADRPRRRLHAADGRRRRGTAPAPRSRVGRRGRRPPADGRRRGAPPTRSAAARRPRASSAPRASAGARCSRTLARQDAAPTAASSRSRSCSASRAWPR